MNDQVRSALSLAGRMMIMTIFVLSAVGNKIPNFNAVAGYMASEGVPLSKAHARRRHRVPAYRKCVGRHRVSGPMGGVAAAGISLPWRHISSTTSGPSRARHARHK